MKKTIFLYGLLGGVLIAGLKLIEYRFLVVEHSLEIYGGLVALLFSTLGIWLGQRLTRTRETVVIREVPASEPFVVNATSLGQLGITPRELEILEAPARSGALQRVPEVRQVESMNTDLRRQQGLASDDMNKPSPANATSRPRPALPAPPQSSGPGTGERWARSGSLAEESPTPIQ